MSSENAVPGNPLGKLDFRATSDDAWYSVMVELDGDIMRLQYCGFSEEHDQVFKASDFKSLSEVDDFEARFRPMSVQVQDSECSKVLQGDVVCTAFSFQHEDVRFYDALVEGVSVSLSISLCLKNVEFFCFFYIQQNDGYIALFIPNLV